MIAENEMNIQIRFNLCT